MNIEVAVLKSMSRKFDRQCQHIKEHFFNIMHMSWKVHGLERFQKLQRTIPSSGIVSIWSTLNMQQQLLDSSHRLSLKSASKERIRKMKFETRIYVNSSRSTDGLQKEWPNSKKRLQTVTPKYLRLRAAKNRACIIKSKIENCNAKTQSDVTFLCNFFKGGRGATTM